jgi:nucleotide-binding universal stress UspA family protein
VYKSILIPTDGSEASQIALQHGLELAKGLGASVTVFFAIENPFLSTWGGFAPSDAGTVGGIMDELRALGHRTLDAALETAQAAGVTAQKALSEDMRVTDAILEAAKGHDLIVMATHGRGGLERVLLGSVTEHVIRHARTPTLVVHPGTKTAQ